MKIKYYLHQVAEEEQTDEVERKTWRIGQGLGQTLVRNSIYIYLLKTFTNNYFT